MRKLDRAIGIVLGLALGAGLVAGFVFWGSNETIDNAAIGNGSSRPDRGQAGGGSQEPPVRTVRIEGCAPPYAAGAPTYDYERGDRVRLRVLSDGTCGLELLGYGIERTVTAGEPALIAFRATRAGNFPLIVTASHIGVADIRVGAGPGL